MRYYTSVKTSAIWNDAVKEALEIKKTVSLTRNWAKTKRC